jgi:predicted ATPase/DNA-binding CsgD family transcriptional regulator
MYPRIIRQGVGNIDQLADFRTQAGLARGATRGWHTQTAMTVAAKSVPSGLPVQLTSFVGRRPELQAVRDLLARVRLVTLTGPGGAGKTRLAWQAAAQEAERYPEGVWWVELAGLTDGNAVAVVAATALGVLVERVRDPLRSLTVHLADRRTLVCLDNAEHLLDDVAVLAEAILRTCPDVTVLVTSREPLGLPGEAVWRVPPLEDDDALQLFVERASLVQPSFTLDPASEAAVRSIAVHLDGIPLAIELAAAWLRTLTPQQILTGLDDRFRLLVRGPRGAQRRQQTLAESIGWSHALLDEFDRQVFRRLSVFAGSFGLEAAHAVCAGGPAEVGEVLPAVARLVDKSLLIAEEHEGEARYQLLETIRAYAAARLVEAREETAVRDRHLTWYVDFAETSDAERERDPDRWQLTLQREYDNLRAALDWGLATDDPALGRRLAASLAWWWQLDRRGRDGIAYLRQAIACAPDDQSRLQARLLAGLALVADTADPLNLEYDAATRALELATEVGDDGLRALCLSLKAVGAFYTNFDEAWAVCDQAVQAAKTGGNEFAHAAARALQAIILHLRDRHADADLLFEEVLPTLLRLHRGVASTVLAFRSNGALYSGRVARALELARQAIRVAEPLGDHLRVGIARSALALVAANAGQLDAAQAAIEPVLRLIGEDEVFVSGLAHAMGVLALWRGELESAVDWFGQEARSTDRGVETWAAAQALAGLGIALMSLDRTDEAATALNRAVAVANRLDMPRVLANALEAQADLVAMDPEPGDRAIDLDHKALALRLDHSLRAFLPNTLEALARHGAAIRPTADDVRILAASHSARETMGLPRWPQQEAAFEATLRLLRESLGATVIDAAWTEGARVSLDDAVAYARRTRGARGRPSTGWASLTPTELEVVRLVAAGLTNPEIGARLFMSRGTVKTHLTHIFTKLEISNRTELATLASGRVTPDRQAR